MHVAKWFVLAGAVLSLIVGTVLAADKAQTLKQAPEKLEPILNESQLREMVDKVGLFKKAGLSYQPTLAVPVEGVVGCKNKEQLRILIGMYTFDANYALLFGRKQEFARANELRDRIPDRLNLRGKLRLRSFTPDELEKVLANPDDPASRALFAKYAAAGAREMIEASKTDQEMLALYLDLGYGTVLEGLYVASKLALAAGTGPNMVALFNEQGARVNRVYQALAAYAGDPELDAFVKRSQRERVLKPVAGILKTKKGNLAKADVEKILSLIEPERSEVVASCK